MGCACKVCGESDPLLFYSGVATYCKEHWKERVRQNRMSKRDYYIQYDKARANLPHRVAARAEYQKTAQGKAAHRAATEKWDSSNTKKRTASIAVNNAVRDGRLMKLPCLVCGAKAHGHHPDYDAPLAVVWLCPKHHKEAHALIG